MSSRESKRKAPLPQKSKAKAGLQAAVAAAAAGAATKTAAARAGVAASRLPRGSDSAVAPNLAGFRNGMAAAFVGHGSSSPPTPNPSAVGSSHGRCGSISPSSPFGHQSSWDPAWDNSTHPPGGFMGSIDCMHWAWKNCPKGWAGMFTRGDKGVPTMILEAVASRNLRIWHAFFGTAGSQNDINVLNKSTLFIDVLKGKAPRVQYTVNGRQYDMGYYLADKIYPEWAVFVKTITAPQTQEDKLYASMQEGARKDVECAFGVLQSRFDIVNRPSRLWKPEDAINMMQACVILRNMTVEDEKELVKVSLDLNENASTTIVLPPEVHTSDTPNPCFADVLRRNSAIKHDQHIDNPEMILLSTYGSATETKKIRHKCFNHV